MHPDLVALVRERYVPFRLNKGMRVPFEDRELYGLSGTSFGSCVLVATAVFRAERGQTADPEQDAFLRRHVLDRQALVAERALKTGTDDTLPGTMDRIERQILVDALRGAGGVQAIAARRLGISERSMWHKVKKHGINVERLKS